MRNLFLTLLLANLLFLAWQLWIEPDSPPTTLQPAGARLALGDAPDGSEAVASAIRPGPPVAPVIPQQSLPVVPGLKPQPEGAPLAAQSSCLRLGPMPDGTVARRAATALAGQGYLADVQELPGQTWLGHWVQIAGFGTREQAEGARRRLMSGGLVDAYLMEDGPGSVVSLGVFRDRSRAERVLAAAQNMGFSPVIRDRVRPTIEPWVLVRLTPGQKGPTIPDLGPGGAWIVRSEATACPAADQPALAEAPVVP